MKLLLQAAQYHGHLWRQNYDDKLRVHEAVHVISNLRLEVCDNSASCGVAEMVSLQELCNVCRFSIKKQFGNFLNVDAPFRDGKARRRHFGRSLLTGFPTQILYTHWTLFSNLFFFLHSIFDGFLSFFFPCWCLCVGPWKCYENCLYFLLVSLYPALPFAP